MRGKKVLSDLLKIIAMTLVVFLILEVSIRVSYFARNSMVTYVPLPYVIGDDYGPMPPWMDGLRLLVPDEALLWKNRPNIRRTYLDVFTPAYSEYKRRSILRQFIPSVPVSLQNNHVWEIALNSRGFRDHEFSISKRPTAFRIICLGDSWTFGANVGQDQAYPQQLSRLLKQEFPEAEFEVLNLGVLGYSSYQGLELLKRNIGELEPDLVIIGYAMNDASVAGYRDRDMHAYNSVNSLAREVQSLLERFELYKLSRYVFQLSREKPLTTGELIKTEAEHLRTHSLNIAERGMVGAQNYAELEPWTRVSPPDYENNIREMIALAKHHHADVVLLNNQLWFESPYLQVLRRTAQAEAVVLIDSSTIIAEARREAEAELEERLGLTPTRKTHMEDGEEIEVLFRVYTGNYPVTKNMYIVGYHPKLGDLVPNKIAMHDDGTHGDQRAGDKVWTYRATFPPGTALFYVYTNSGAEGEWEGLDLPHVRAFRVDAATAKKQIFKPIEIFGSIYLRADGWHTNAEGYGLIAKAVLEVLKKNEMVKDYLTHVKTDGY